MKRLAYILVLLSGFYGNFSLAESGQCTCVKIISENDNGDVYYSECSMAWSQGGDACENFCMDSGYNSGSITYGKENTSTDCSRPSPDL